MKKRKNVRERERALEYFEGGGGGGGGGKANEACLGTYSYIVNVCARETFVRNVRTVHTQFVYSSFKTEGRKEGSVVVCVRVCSFFLSFQSVKLQRRSTDAIDTS